ncbi:hypothetical protein KVH09_03195 [Streptomyces olivaceus]|nr:hypothetical protein [Streptomyces olivaceus]
MLRLLGGCRVDLDAGQLLDVLWLARRLPAGAEAPLHRQVPDRTQQPPPADGPDTPERPVPQQRTSEPGDPDLPDLTSPTTLHAGARHAPEPSPRFASAGHEPRRALPVRVPEEKALGGELALGRSLRPLRRRHDSRHRTEIDEDRTAAQLAETHLPDVVERPVRERWLDLVLLVDDGLSMLLWHRLGTELRTLLERLGAFAVTRVLGLDTRSASGPRLHARPFGSGSTELPLSTVNDPSGRTLLLVVSDGMGPAWRSGAMHALLAERAARGPAAVLHTLPPDMWGASGIAAERWQATTRRVGGANTSWKVVDPVLPPELSHFDDIPVPVLEPTAGSLGVWARLLASPGTTVELPLLAGPDRYDAVAPARDLSSAQHFRDAATPEAYRLAAHLAAVAPLSVPVMRLVQTAVPWPATTSHLAEVFLGGLVRPHPAPVSGPLPAKHRCSTSPTPPRPYCWTRSRRPNCCAPAAGSGAAWRNWPETRRTSRPGCSTPTAPTRCPAPSSRSRGSSAGCSPGSGCRSAGRPPRPVPVRGAPPAPTPAPTTGTRSPRTTRAVSGGTSCAAVGAGGARSSTGASTPGARRPCCGCRARTCPPSTPGSSRWRPRRWAGCRASTRRCCSPPGSRTPRPGSP